MKAKDNVTPLQFEHVDGSLRLTLTQSTIKGWDVHESTVSLIVPHHEVPETVERMLTTPDTDLQSLRNSEEIQNLSRSEMSAPEMLDKAYKLIVAANVKTHRKKALKEKGRLIKIAKAFYGMTDSEWEDLDPSTRDSYIANALRAEQVMTE